ncbi:MAG: hypothetical protein LBT01_08415 [Spirochaetaceae bacterium]|jgi:hypothetical protein|nr:hypothetical protein [Spirochaetaceae bacterium]
MRKEMKMKLLVCTAFTVLAFASCNAIADTSGLSITPETVWLRLTASEPELVNGLRTATLVLDFDKPLDGLTDGLPEAELGKIFSFSNDDPSSAPVDIKAIGIKKSVVSVYTLTVVNVPEATEGMVLVKITQKGVTPTIRPWFLDGKSGPPATEQASAVGGNKRSNFTAVVKDADACTYAVGTQYGTEKFTYGAGVSVQGTADGDHANAVLVKYDSTGAALWAKVVQASGAEGQSYSWQSNFYGVAVDSSGAIYVVGAQSGQGTYTYGPNVSTTASSGRYAIIVKYDNSGAALWAKTTDSDSASGFNGVAADGVGNVYAVGTQYGNTVYDYDNGKTATGGCSGNSNAVIVQYNSSTGSTNWAQSVKGADQMSEFFGVAADASGNAYAVGVQSDPGTFFYDGGGSVTGAYENNAVMVKYDSTGAVLWAQAASGGNAIFQGLALDEADHICVVGFQTGDQALSYGTNSKSAKGVSSGMNAVLVRFNTAGAALWATAAQSEAESMFFGVAADGRGNIYAAGLQFGDEAFDYGGASATGGSPQFSSSIVQYDSGTGKALWAQAVSGAVEYSIFNGVAANVHGSITTVGVQNGSEVFDYGNNITAKGSYDTKSEKDNIAVIVWYK